MELGNSFDKGRVRSVATAAAEALELAAIGAEPWQVALRLLNAEFPNAYFALVNQDFLHDKVNFAISWNLDDELLRRYSDYYASINPYKALWTQVKSGEILSSEAVFPVKNIRNTEFYNDWLIKAERRAAGIGLKLDASPTDTIYLPMHCPEDHIDRYSPACMELLRQLRAPLERAINISSAVQQAGAGITARAALADRHQGPALVLDHSMHILDANEEAVIFLRKADFMLSRYGKLSFREKHLSERIARCVMDLGSSALSQVSRLGWDEGSRKWILSLTRLPSDPVQRLLAPRPQILLQMLDLRGRVVTRDLTEFARLFELTPAETRLAAALADGLSLSEAAGSLAITFETARQRLKHIFQKTGTAKQSELCAMLARYPG